MASIQDCRAALQACCFDYLERRCRSGNPRPERRVREAIANAGKSVHGMGVGYKKVRGKVTKTICVRCHVVQKLANSLLPPRDRIPDHFDGVPTDVIVSSQMYGLAHKKRTSRTRRARVSGIACEEAPRQRQRPVMGGISAAHHDVTAGTIGFFCRSTRPGDDPTRVYAVSNNHVFADLNDGVEGEALCQPGPAHGGMPNDRFADLGRFKQIRFGFGETNRVDAALGRLRDGVNYLPEVRQIGTITGTLQPALGMKVRKYGAATCLTHGVVSEVCHTRSIDYDNGDRFAFFSDQICVESDNDMPFLLGGDSGSLLFHRTSRKAVGLIHAGLGEGGMAIASPIDFVLSELEIEFV